MTGAILQTVALSKRFGGLLAVNAVALDVHLGRIHAVIGPNGAGKTTLINLLSGDLPPSSGRIVFDGRQVAGLPPDRIARLGIARSYQKTNIFPAFTAFENCRLAAQSRLRTSMRFFRPARSYVAINDAAERALGLVGLGREADRSADSLSHGEQRQ